MSSFAPLGNLRDVISHLVQSAHPQQQLQGQRSQPLAPALQHMQYAQYMNPDGSGGGFGPQAPAPQLHGSLGGHENFSPQGMQNPGFVPLQNGGQAQTGSNPYASGLQPSLLNYRPYTGLQVSGNSPQQGITYDNYN